MVADTLRNSMGLTLEQEPGYLALRLWVLCLYCFRNNFFKSVSGLNEISLPYMVQCLSDQTREVGCCSVTQSHPTLCDPMDWSTPGFPVLHHLLELAQTHVHRVGDAIQPSRPLSSPSPPALSLSQHQGLFQSVGSSYREAKVLSFGFSISLSSEY